MDPFERRRSFSLIPVLVLEMDVNGTKTGEGQDVHSRDPDPSEMQWNVFIGD